MTEWKPTNNIANQDVYDPPSDDGPEITKGKEKKGPAVKSAVAGGKV